MDRACIKTLTAELYRSLSNEETAATLDKIKSLGFHYATVSGITIAINDIQVSPKKAEILRRAAALVDGYEDQYLSGLMSEDERYNLAVEAWTRASDQTEELVKEDLSNYGGIAVMAVSGAKGNISQIKQMAGMRGLMSNPKGRIIDLPIKSSFREGLTALEYFISTHGARKGLADTALRTADSGYLTRRLIDIAQEVIALEYDCGTLDAYWVQSRQDDLQKSTLAERIVGRIMAAPVAHPETGEIIADRNDEINEQVAAIIVGAGITEVPVRSPLNCESHRGVCQLCYGRLPATGNLVELGQATGIIAAQSIGEPGTQLTMRTFHTGGIAGTDITSGLPRVEELFEARVPKGSALLADIDGIVEIETDEEGRRLRVVSREEFREDYALPEGARLLVDDGEYVEPGMILASSLPSLLGEADGIEDLDADAGNEIVAGIGGRVELTADSISIIWEDVEEREHLIPASSYILVSDGATVKAGDALTAGPLNPHDILHIRGKDELQRYLVNEVQLVYRSQGVGIHDKHIEIILRQMLRRVQVESTGDSDYIPGQLVDKFEFQERNAKLLAEGGEPATAKPILLGVTRASLLTDSFLAAASFQETTRVLTQAAVSGAHDWLLGLKENVIIGRLIPAQVASTALGQEPEPELPPQLADLVPAGWLEARDDSKAGPFSFARAAEVASASAFIADEDEEVVIDDVDHADLLTNGHAALFGESNGNGKSDDGEVMGFGGFPEMGGSDQ
jgi:DNA-directed RNA polymerase subunit beta'